VDALGFYLEEGMRLRRLIDELLPDDWSWKGKRALDFGCGSARVLRHFAPEAQDGKFTGCDIDHASILWDREHLTPPFEFFENGLAPPLPLPDESFDLIWAMSVFTHITDRWAEWLAELHRLLAPGGVLIASFLGRAMWEPLVGEPYDEQAVGMAVLHHWEGPDAWVFHSEWWLREHWGRAFDVLEIRQPPVGLDGSEQITHSHIALRRRDGSPSPADLARIAPGEPRELAGLQTALRLAYAEMSELAAARPAPRVSMGARVRGRLARLRSA
jgi:SAM-dependent methyltransferase